MTLERTVVLVTRWVILGPIAIWAVWELVLLWLRGRGYNVPTISMEARSIASRGLPTLAFILAGMTAHWFITWKRLPWEGTVAVVLAAAWWALAVAYALADWLDPNRVHWPVLTQYVRHPTGAALIGGVTAWLMFGQRSLWTPGAPT